MDYPYLNNQKYSSRDEFNKRLKQFILNIIKLTEALPNETTYRVIKDQIIRSSTSIGANYFEARAASSKNDFVNFFNHSLKSANETKFWLEILIDLNKYDIQQVRILLQEVAEIANIFASSILTLRGKR